MTSEEPGKRSPAVEAGLTVRREVMGPDFVERALTRTSGTDSEQLQEFVTEHVWDAVWNRPGLDRRSLASSTSACSSRCVHTVS